MEHVKQPDVAERVADLALAEPYARALFTIRGYAAGLLDTGYPREALYEDFECARGVLEGRGAPEEAEDVVQQTFAAAYSTLLADEREIALKPWLYAIARNGCLSVLRVQREHLPLEDGDARLPATVGLSVEVEQREDLRALLVDLQRLPEDQRAALILAELGAETHEEIALVLGVPAVKVRALVFQAREALMSRRLGREADCGPIREQLAFLRGGARRRRELRHHVAQCAGCQAFEAETSRQRAGMAVLLPVAPTFALKQSSLAAAFAAGGSGAAQIGGAAAGGATAGGATAGGVTAGGVTAGGVSAGGAGSAYTVVGGALAGSSAAGGAASIGGAAALSGGGVLAGAKLVGLKALLGLALTGVTAGGYTAVRPDDDAPPPPAAQVIANVPDPSQKAAPKPPPPAGVVAPIAADDCRKAAAGANGCAVKASKDPAAAGAGTSARPGESASQGVNGEHNGAGAPTSPRADPGSAGVPATRPGDRDGDGVPNAEDRCPARLGAVRGCPRPAVDPPASAPTPGDRDGDGVPNGQDSDRDGDGVPNAEDRCPNRPGTVHGCPVAPANPAPRPPTDPSAPRPTPTGPDGDGIPSTQDGDRDGDGVPNASDRDGDGVLNRDDRCPNRFGTVDGCPADEPPGLGIAVPGPVAP